ncbi:hypothetical protein OLM99_20745, partial [Pseudomonas aeruginosa]|uniref:hypothetical protein n=1 Tax=Pseudomonas aeruginosa TaxID=287 RepID=UPI0024974372
GMGRTLLFQQNRPEAALRKRPRKKHGLVDIRHDLILGPPPIVANAKLKHQHKLTFSLKIKKLEAP